MAILKDIKVVIIVDGQELQEYCDEDAMSDKQSSVSNYVEATSDAHFQIRSSAPGSYQFTSDAIVMRVYLDGVPVDTVSTTKEMATYHQAWDMVSEGSEGWTSHGWRLRPFTFIEFKPGTVFQKL